VSDAKDKRDLIKEALRVVRKGGAFAFQDFFLAKQLYGDVEELREAFRKWGFERVEFLDTSRSGIVPKALRLPFMLSTISFALG
jgi:ubiquinone/menaquinone biosynthesis C-methylase UbiE